jgi:DNA-binding transcriptional ArsR family regulator
MNVSGQLWKAASLIGDRSRATMLWSLQGGESRPASELAMLANVSPQTASNHLRLLLDAGFVKVEAVGRNKFYRLAGRSLALALESLAGAIPAGRPALGTAQQASPELVFARTCYDHLAGELSVAILRRLLEKNYLEDRNKDYRLTANGQDFFLRLNIQVNAVREERRRFAYPCLDWSHRVPHLGGALGAALLDCLVSARIVVRHKTNRVIRVTASGHEQLHRFFAIRLTRSGTAIQQAEV